MNTKTIIAMAVAGALATAGFADEAFDNLVKLANTPKEQITAANAAQILDASIAVTNGSALVHVVEAKALTFSDVFAKAKDKAEFFRVIYNIGQKYGTAAEQEEAFKNFIDTWIALDEDAQKNNLLFGAWTVLDWKSKTFMDSSAIEEACRKIAASNSSLKGAAIAGMLFPYGAYRYIEGSDALIEQYFDLVRDSVLSGKLTNAWAFDFASYVHVVKRDYVLCSQLINNIELFKRYSSSSTLTPPFIGTIYKYLEPTLSGIRKQYLATCATADFQLVTVARVQDKVDGNKKTTESIYSKLAAVSTKLETAFYLNDNDKMIDVLLTIDNSISPELIEKAVAQINTFDPDYRAADVLKALRVINKKYTLKLYDDRDTWEPILSKVRALIDTYNN